LSVVFFTDRDLGKRFPLTLASAGLAVERHDDLFPPDCPDERWLAYVGTSGRVAVTHNERIRYMPNERDAVVRHRVALIVVSGKAPLQELADNFVRTMPRISAFLAKHDAPFIANVYRPTLKELARRADCPGTISLWYQPAKG
jgi:PIN like domain